MASSSAHRPSRRYHPGRRSPLGKKPERYHHGDLPHAMLREAIRTIQKDGVAQLTLRGVGDALGVSRTALYRHFRNKNALLRAVAIDGFRTLRAELLQAWTAGGRGRAGFEAMGAAYIRFAVRHPSHYRVMFGGLIRGDDDTPAWDADTDAFGALVQALVEQQQAGLVRPDPPRQLALYVWSVVHGVAMLAIDGVLPPTEIEMLTGFAIDRLLTGVRS